MVEEQAGINVTRVHADKSRSREHRAMASRRTSAQHVEEKRLALVEKGLWYGGGISGSRLVSQM